MANDHYIPQFYLRSFQAEPGKVWLYERGQKPRLRGIRSVASEDNYYTLKSNITGVAKDKVDKIFQRLENGTAPIIAHLKTAPRIDLVPNDLEVLAIFIAHLVNRTPHQREQLMNLHSVAHKKMAKFFAGNKEAYYKYAKEAGLDSDPQALEQSRMMPFDPTFKVVYDAEGSADYFLRFALEMAELVTPYIQNKHWSLFESKTSRVFVTSDNPVVLVPPENLGRFEGVGFENAYISIPLTPKRCLFLANRRGPNDLTLVSRDAVNEVNSWTIRRAHKQIYANLKTEELREAFDKTVEGQNTKVIVEGSLTKEDFLIEDENKEK